MSDPALERAATDLAATGRWLHGLGWVPATSGNFSVRLDAQRIAITASGADKGALTAEGVLVVDLDARPLGAGRPSAETLLHTRIYRRFPTTQAVLHTHSVAATVLSRRLGAGARLSLEGFELAKAFPGISDHETPLVLPVIANSQDTAAMAAAADAALNAGGCAPGYLIVGHGTYTWAADLPTARRQLEALEFLFTCAVHEGSA